MQGNPTPASWNIEEVHKAVYIQRPNAANPLPPPTPPPQYHTAPTPVPDISLQSKLPPGFNLNSNSILPKEIPTTYFPHTTSSQLEELSDSIPSTPKKGIHDKNLWTSEAMKDHPDILEIMERIRPLNRAASFGRLFDVGQTRVPDEIMGRDTLLQLIMQHLQFEGLRASRKILEAEAQTRYVDYQLSESRLVTLMRLAIRDTEKVWELAMLSESKQEKQKLLEEHLYELGLLPEGTANQDLYVSSTLSMNNNNDNREIWDEPEGRNVMYSDDKEVHMSTLLNSSSMNSVSPSRSSRPIKAGSLNHLVVALTPENHYDPDYVNTFLLTYQSFTTPAKLLEKLIERFHVPMKEGMTNDEWKKISLAVHVRVGKVLQQWMKEHWSDFTPSLIESVKAFIDNSLRLDGNQLLVKTLTQTLNAQLRPETSEITRTFSELPPEPKVPRNIFSSSLSILDVDDEEIARQMTLIDYDLLCTIKPSELLNQAWNKIKLRHRSPNVLKAISRFNDVSKWTASTILRVERVKERARIMTKFIRIAEYALKRLNNFNAAMAILAGLNNAAVHRLKYTKEEIPKSASQTYEELHVILSANASYKEYRTALANVDGPCVPYLGVYLTDLTFIEDGISDNIEGLINFYKRRQVYGVIARVKKCQQSPYNLQSVYQVACLLMNPARDGVDEETMYHMSQVREPRGKDRSEIL